MNAALTAAIARNSDARAKLAAERAAIVTPHAARIAALTNAGAVVEIDAFPACGREGSLVRARVWIFDQRGRLHITAKMESHGGGPLRGTFHVDSSDARGYCDAPEIVAAAQAAQITRVN